MDSAWQILYVLFGLIQFFAFIEGARILLDIGTILAALAFIVLGMVPFAGGLIIIYAGFVGANQGWKLPWWLALVLVFPGVLFYFYAFASGGFSVLLEASG